LIPPWKSPYESFKDYKRAKSAKPGQFHRKNSIPIPANLATPTPESPLNLYKTAASIQQGMHPLEI